MRLSPPSAPNLLHRLRLIKTLARRTARALSQHFANLHSSHTKLENDTKWWASNRASWKVFGHTSRGKSHRHLVHDISTRQTRQFDRRTTRTECERRGRILAAEKRRKDEWLRGDFGGGRMWLGLVPPGRGDELVVHQCNAVHLLVLPAAEQCAFRDPGGKNGAGLRTGDWTCKSR